MVRELTESSLTCITVNTKAGSAVAMSRADVLRGSGVATRLGQDRRKAGTTLI